MIRRSINAAALINRDYSSHNCCAQVIINGVASLRPWPRPTPSARLQLLGGYLLALVMDAPYQAATTTYALGRWLPVS